MQYTVRILNIISEILCFFILINYLKMQEIPEKCGDKDIARKLLYKTGGYAYGKEKNKKKSETEYKSVKKETAKNKWIESK